MELRHDELPDASVRSNRAGSEKYTLRPGNGGDRKLFRCRDGDCCPENSWSNKISVNGSVASLQRKNELGVWEEVTDDTAQISMHISAGYCTKAGFVPTGS